MNVGSRHPNSTSVTLPYMEGSGAPGLEADKELRQPVPLDLRAALGTARAPCPPVQERGSGNGPQNTDESVSGTKWLSTGVEARELQQSVRRGSAQTGGLVRRPGPAPVQAPWRLEAQVWAEAGFGGAGL